MADFTPGPWAIITDDDASLQISVDGDDEENGHVVTEWLVVESVEYAGFAAAVIGLNSPNCYDDEQLSANARLIALAPEMYEYIASSASNGCATAQALIARTKGGAA